YLLVLAAAWLGCAGKHAREAPDAHNGTDKPTPPIASAAAPPQSALSSAATGPCAGAPVGSYRCDGLNVVRGGERSPELVRPCLSSEPCTAKQAIGAPACPAGEVYIPPTSGNGFTMGKGELRFGFGSRASRNPGQGTADLPHKVVLTRPF